MFLLLAGALATLVVTAAFLLILHARSNYGILEKCGIPVITPGFVLGSVPDIHEKVQHFEDIRREEMFGPIWGLYQGRSPLIFVADPDLIKRIFVQDTQYFFDREAFNFGHPVINEILDYLPGEKWKSMRVSQTRLFSTGKIRQYSSSVFSEIMHEFCSKLDGELRASVDGRLKIDARQRFCTYTVDAIGRTLFSMKVEPRDDNEFYTGWKKTDWRWSSHLEILYLDSFEPSIVLDPAIVRTFATLLKARKAEGTDTKKDDYPEVMLHLQSQLGSEQFRKLGITETTLYGQAVNLFLAGFDRISTMMTFLMYHLAEKVEFQERLHQELIDSAEGDEETPYLNACINEVFRLYPTFIRPERVCTKDWACEERGIRIPKGVVVQIPSWAVNRNPKYYENPNDFYPERFLPENKGNLNPYAATSFGFGHRVCIGTRFAFEAMRASVSHLVKGYKFFLREDTKIEFKKGIILILQYEPIYLDVTKRNN